MTDNVYIHFEDLASALVGPFDSLQTAAAHVRQCTKHAKHYNPDSFQGILREGSSTFNMVKSMYNGRISVLTPDKNLELVKFGHPYNK